MRIKKTFLQLSLILLLTIIISQTATAFVQSCGDSGFKSTLNGQTVSWSCSSILSSNYPSQFVSSCESLCGCNWQGGSINHGASVTAYQSPSVPYGQSCVSQIRTCSQCSLSGSYQYASCTVGPASSCNLPWGGTITSGSSVTAYQNSNVGCASKDCASETRICNNGVLSGSYLYSSCRKIVCGDDEFKNVPYCVNNACVQCSSPSHCFDNNYCTANQCSGNACSYATIHNAAPQSPPSIIPSNINLCCNGAGVDKNTNTNNCGTCGNVCGIGTNTGRPYCVSGSCKQCTSDSHCEVGGTCTASNNCSYGGLCADCGIGWNNICDRSECEGFPQGCCYKPITGDLWGSCSANTCGDGCRVGSEQCDNAANNGVTCTPTYGSSCTYCSNTCTQITLYGPKCGDGTCNNGETYNTCPTDCPPSSCTFNEQTITHEQSTTAYQTSNVSFGQNCNSQTRTCNNGVLSGTYQYQSCTVGPPITCSNNAQCNDNNACTTDTCNNPGLTSSYCTNTAITPTCPPTSSVNCGSTINPTNNCGTCTGTGTYCASGNYCNNGACTPTCSPLNGQTCTKTCYTGTTYDCNGACTGGTAITPTCPPTSSVNCGSTINPTNNCGTCTGTGTSCPTGNYCNNGACTCSDTRTNTQICGIKTCGTTNDNCGTPRTCGTCSGSTPHCISDSCKQCTQNSQCLQGQVCNSNVCEYPPQNVCNDCGNGWFNTCDQAECQGISASCCYKSGFLSGTCNTNTCGDGCKIGLEQCDNAANNGVTCTPTYDSSCTYCSNTCTQITLYGPKCGDGTCNNGETYNTCPTDCPPSSCTFNEQTITHEQSTTAYQTSNVSFGQNCNSQTRTCNNGVLSGTYQYQSCTVGPAPSCNLPWGGTTPHNTNVTAYQTSSVSLGQNCNSQTRNCNAGTLSGSYTYQTCSVQGSPSCNLPWGGSIPHGDSTTAYLTNSVACGQTCNSQTRNCNNGALSGSYTQQICNVALCPGKCNKDSDCLRISLDDIYTPLCVDGNCTCLYDKQGIYYHPTLGCTRERNPCVTEKMSRLKSNMDAEAIHSRYLYDDGSTYCWKNCGSRGWVIDCAEPVTWFDNRPV